VSALARENPDRPEMWGGAGGNGPTFVLRVSTPPSVIVLSNPVPSSPRIPRPAPAPRVPGRIVGYYVSNPNPRPGHGRDGDYICTDAECLAYYPDGEREPIHIEDATDEGHTFFCSSCGEELEYR
jgi:hypothetical protein